MTKPYLINSIDMTVDTLIPDIWLKGYGDSPIANTGTGNFGSPLNVTTTSASEGPRGAFAFRDNSAFRYITLSCADTGMFTFESWVRLVMAGWPRHIITAGSYALLSTFECRTLVGYSSASERYHIFDVSGVYGSLRDRSTYPATPVTPASMGSAWHHHAITRDETGRIMLFYDGILIAYTDAANALPKTNIKMTALDIPGTGSSGFAYDYRVYANYCKYTKDFDTSLI